MWQRRYTEKAWTSTLNSAGNISRHWKLSFPCSIREFFPWQTGLHGLLQYEPIPWAAVLQELLQHGSLLQGVQYFRSSVGTSQGHRSYQETCSSTGSSLQESKITARSLLQHRYPMASQPSFRNPPALVWSPPWPAGASLHPCAPPRAAPEAEGESHPCLLEHLLPFLHWPLWLQSSSSHTFSLFSESNYILSITFLPS